MSPSVTHLRRSIHPLSSTGKQEVAVTSWYDTRLQTWQATSSDFPYFANARARSAPEVSLTRRDAVQRLLTCLHTSLQR